LLNFVDFSNIQKYPDTWIPMDKLSMIHILLSMVSNYSSIHDIQLSMVSNYPSIHGIQVSMVSKYPDIRKKWYPLIPIYKETKWFEISVFLAEKDNLTRFFLLHFCDFIYRVALLCF
jgi:hypothetical protein